MNKNITATTILAAGLLFSFFDVAFAVAPWSLFGSALPIKQGESPNHWALELTYAGMNSYAGVKFQDPSRTLIFDKIWNLSADYKVDVPPYAKGIFTDVSADHWAAPWIEQLYQESITAGCSTSPMKFCPEDSVTRAQMAAFLARTFDL